MPRRILDLSPSRSSMRAISSLALLTLLSRVWGGEYQLGGRFTLTIDESNTSQAPSLSVTTLSSSSASTVVLESISSSSVFLDVQNFFDENLRGSKIPPFIAMGTSKVTRDPIIEVRKPLISPAYPLKSMPTSTVLTPNAFTIGYQTSDAVPHEGEGEGKTQSS